MIGASTGNNAASVSAFAARAGPCVVVLPRATPVNKTAQAKAQGAIVLEVDGSFSDAYAASSRIQAKTEDCANLTSTYLNPYMTAAHATIFYEVQAELGDIGTIIVPTGAGPMPDGIMQGAEKLKTAGQICRLPVPVGG